MRLPHVAAAPARAAAAAPEAAPAPAAALAEAPEPAAACAGSAAAARATAAAGADATCGAAAAACAGAATAAGAGSIDAAEDLMEMNGSTHLRSYWQEATARSLMFSCPSRGISRSAPPTTHGTQTQRLNLACRENASLRALMPIPRKLSHGPAKRRCPKTRLYDGMY